MLELKKQKLTQKRLKEVLDYNPSTGEWFWKVKANHYVLPGDRAGSISNGYWYIGVFGRIYKAARLAFLYMEGFTPEQEVDHKDQDPMNEKWDNLRDVSHQCNMRNIKIYSHNTSGVTGVCWTKRGGKWLAHITVNNKLKNGGLFIDFGDAVMARWNLEKKYGWPNCQTLSSSYLYLKERGLAC